MNRKMTLGGLVSGALLLTSGMAAAQENAAAVRVDAVAGSQVFVFQQAEVPPMAPPGAGNVAFMAEGVELLGFGGLHGGKVVTGAPFTATAISESTQTLADGNHITRKTQTNLYRDSQGRFRKEVSLTGIGPLAATGKPHSFTVIQDPVAGSTFVLEQDEKIARKLPSKPLPPPGTAVTDSKDHVEYHQASQQDVIKKESLGTQNFDGVSAEGTRATQTIPVGEIGNEMPITIVSETWYSNDLKMTVVSKRSDPRFGDTTYTLTNIQRSEPDASLFAVPAGYTIEEGGPRLKHMHIEAQPPSN